LFSQCSTPPLFESFFLHQWVLKFPLPFSLLFPPFSLRSCARANPFWSPLLLSFAASASSDVKKTPSLSPWENSAPCRFSFQCCPPFSFFFFSRERHKPLFFNFLFVFFPCRFVSSVSGRERLFFRVSFFFFPPALASFWVP